MKEKDRRGSSGDRFAVFPFSIGCMSQSSVAVTDPNEKKQQQQSNTSSSAASATTTPATTAQSVEEEAATKEKAATPALSPGIVTAGVQRLVKGIKSMFAVYDVEDDDEKEQEMVIGYPTDVQHVGHIGWDGLNKVGGAMGMANAFSLPSSLSFRQLEVAMNQAAHA